MPQLSALSTGPVRDGQDPSLEHESSAKPGHVFPSMQERQSFDLGSDLESGHSLECPTAGRSGNLKSPAVSVSPLEEDFSPSYDHAAPHFYTKARSLWTRLSFFPYLRSKPHSLDKGQRQRRATPFRRALRLLAVALMLLGIIEFIVLACGLLSAFFPDEFDDSFDALYSSSRIPSSYRHWPTDFSADVQPVACHSHNDYWRKEPLFSALNAGCTGVEADVWLFDQELFVGHSTASLQPERTLRNLYIDPLLDILSKQNPQTSFHPSLDQPRNGVFDTDPFQTLVLLIDFKTDGEILWSHVSDQLQPLREQHYLTYFNGTSIVEGPITVVVTGNAPFSAVVADLNYRDMFFDAPLALMESLSTTKGLIKPPTYDTTLDYVGGGQSPKRSDEQNQGQGSSGSAPSNPAVYSLANSYYASVDFRSSIGIPWRGHLSPAQKEKLRKQIQGAHSRGLKVRYWGVPSWPRGLRNYLWRVLVREGVDYLNVDDLHSATTGKWGWGDRSPWWSGSWKFWPSRRPS